MILPLNGSGKDTVASILSKKPNYTWLQKVKAYAWRAKMHMTGIGKEKAISLLDYFEDERLLRIRQKYTPDNRDFYGRLHRPIDKIWNAKGGSVSVSLPDSGKKAMFDYLSNVHNGYSLKEWLKTFWLPAMQYDVMGLVVMEVGDNTTYPCYWPIDTVYEMPKPKGRKVEWIIFKLNRDKKPQGVNLPPIDDIVTKVGAAAGYYRVIDDAYDRTVYYNGSVVEEIPDETYPNYYGFVPAITCGDIWSDSEDMYISPNHDTLDTADQYMRQRGNLVMYEMHHGFPLSWQYATPCNTCAGTGFTNSDKCPTCNGSRVNSKGDVAKLLILPFPNSKDMPVLDKPGGQVEAAVDSWQEMKLSVKDKYQEAHYCTWGTHQVEDSSSAQPATATGRFIDVQPVNDRLDYYSSAAEYVYMWVANMAGRFSFNVDKCCECNLGRRYLIETADELNKKLQEAIRAGMNYSFLRDMYMRWLDSEYSGDETMRMKLLYEFKLDPAPFMTVQQSQTAFIDPKDYQKKLYFGQWLESLPDNWFITNNLDYWRQNLTTYVDAIIATQPKIEPEKTGTLA